MNIKDEKVADFKHYILNEAQKFKRAQDCRYITSLMGILDEFNIMIDDDN